MIFCFFDCPDLAEILFQTVLFLLNNILFVSQPTIGKPLTGADGTVVTFTSLDYLQKVYAGTTK